MSNIQGTALRTLNTVGGAIVGAAYKKEQKANEAERIQIAKEKQAAEAKEKVAAEAKQREAEAIKAEQKRKDDAYASLTDTQKLVFNDLNNIDPEWDFDEKLSIVKDQEDDSLAEMIAESRTRKSKFEALVSDKMETYNGTVNVDVEKAAQANLQAQNIQQDYELQKEMVKNHQNRLKAAKTLKKLKRQIHLRGGNK